MRIETRQLRDGSWRGMIDGETVAIANNQAAAFELARQTSVARFSRQRSRLTVVDGRHDPSEAEVLESYKLHNG